MFVALTGRFSDVQSFLIYVYFSTIIRKIHLKHIVAQPLRCQGTYTIYELRIVYVPGIEIKKP